MTIKLASLAADLTREREGEWVEPKQWYGLDPEKPNEATKLPGLAFLVRSDNYPDYVVARQKAREELARDYPDDPVPPEVLARMDGQLIARHLLIGWRGFDAEYSAEQAHDLLAAEEHRVLRAMIGWCAGRVGKRHIEFVENGTKNSGRSSAGD